MEPKIIGTVLPVLELSMQPGDKVFAESGQLSWMSMAIQMQTSTSAGGQQGGFLGALGRAVAGGTLFMTEYTKSVRSEEHTSELQSRNDISYAVFCLKK